LKQLPFQVSYYDLASAEYFCRVKNRVATRRKIILLIFLQKREQEEKERFRKQCQEEEKKYQQRVEELMNKPEKFCVHPFRLKIEGRAK